MHALKEKRVEREDDDNHPANRQFPQCSQNSTDERPFRVYSDRSGLYGGAALKGGAITPDDEANRKYYGEYFTVHDILFHKKVKPTETAKEIAKKLTEASKPPKK